MTYSGVVAGGGADEDGQTVTMTVNNEHPSVITITSFDDTGFVFTTVADAIGDATITVTATDDGPTGSPSVNTFSQMFTITVNAIDDAPTFDNISAAEVDEDGTLADIVIEGIGPGGGDDELTQTVTISVESDNETLLPTPVKFGDDTLSFSLQPDMNGTANITVTATDDGSNDSSNENTYAQTFTVTVNAVNDAPVFDEIAAITVDEDPEPGSVTVTGVGPGGGDDESGQTVTMGVVSNDTALVEITSFDGSGFTYTPVADANGTTTITVTATDDGDATAPNVNEYIQQVTITVNAVNDAPTFDDIADVTIAEDNSATAVQVTNIDPGGGADEASQTVTLDAKSADTTLITDLTVSGDTVTFTPEPDANGQVQITVTATDDGESDSPNVNAYSYTFVVTVTAVNDAPVFDEVADMDVDEDAGSADVTFTGVGPGGGDDESGQTVTMDVVSNNTELVEVTSFDDAGFTYTTVPDANGSAVITITATDDGDGASPNVNTFSATFTATVQADNDAPTLDPIAGGTVDEDSGPFDVVLNGVTPGGGADEAKQTLVITAESSHPSILPDATVSGTTLTFESEPDANVDTLGISAVTITVTIDDGQSKNATVVETFDVVVLPVNDVPTIDDLSATDLDKLANLAGVLVEGDAITVDLTGISYGQGLDEETQPITVSAEVTAEKSSTGFPMFANLSVDPSDATVGLTAATLSFTLGAFGGGEAIITVSVDDGLDTTTLDVLVHVNPQNPPPDFALMLGGLTIIDLLPDVEGSIALDEDFDTLTFDITDVDPGDVPGETPQTLTWAVTNSHPAIISLARLDSLNNPTTLTLTVAPDANTEATGPVTIVVATTDQSTQDGFTALTTEKTLTVDIRPVNDLPVVSIVGVNGSVVPGGRNTPLTFQLAVTDVENDLSSSTVGLEVTGDTVVGSFEFDSATLEVSYTPASDWTGQDSLLVTASDGEGTTEFSVTIDVTNDLPGAFSDAYEVAENGSVSPLLIASDANGDTLTYNVTVAPTLGVLSGEGALRSYTPNRQPTEGFIGTDSFTWVANDGIGDSEPAIITITITPVNDPPTAFVVDPSGSVQAKSGEALTFTLFAEDIDGDLITFSATTTAGGTVEILDGIATYTQTSAEDVEELITFTASDGLEEAVPEVVVANVQAPNNDPVAGPQEPVLVVEGESIPITLVGSDLDGDPLTFTIEKAPTLGVLTGE
ncbi:MAG: Ig-like domain-containing protein, partial [Candidatus Poribacteria bacterium]